VSERMSPEELIRYISESPKRTIAKFYVKTKDPEGLARELEERVEDAKVFTGTDHVVAVGEHDDILEVLNTRDDVKYYHKELDHRNRAVPLADYGEFEDVRIEPGAIIRDKVELGKGVVVMMGAVINIGARIGDGTMVDMNAVVGSRAEIGKNVHVGAGAVIAGVLEPPSAKPVVIEDNVVIGANAVILEGVRVGEGSVVAAGAVVTEDVPPGKVVAGVPARVVKDVDEKTEAKTQIVDALRKL